MKLCFGAREVFRNIGLARSRDPARRSCLLGIDEAQNNLTGTEAQLQWTLFVRESNSICWSLDDKDESLVLISEEANEANLRKATFESALLSVGRLVVPNYVGKDRKTEGWPIMLQP